MNVTCPNCATVYRVDPAKVPATAGPLSPAPGSGLVGGDRGVPLMAGSLRRPCRIGPVTENAISTRSGYETQHQRFSPLTLIAGTNDFERRLLPEFGPVCEGDERNELFQRPRLRSD